MRQTASAYRSYLLSQVNAASYFFSSSAKDAIGFIKVPNALVRSHFTINPKLISHKCGVGRVGVTKRPLFEPGDWDLRHRALQDVVESDNRFVTCKEILLERTPIEETTEYRDLIDQLNTKGRARRVLESPEAIHDYMVRIESMYWEMSNSRKVHASQRGVFRRFPSDITCVIDRNGSLVLSADGNHRFAAALVLGILAPIQISAIHQSWLPSLTSRSRAESLSSLNSFIESVAGRHC